MLRKVVLIFAATALSAGLAAAGDKEKSASVDATFKSMDRNGDNYLTISEVASDKMLTEQFGMVDEDRDGQLTKREYSAHLKDMKDKPSKKDY